MAVVPVVMALLLALPMVTGTTTATMPASVRPVAAPEFRYEVTRNAGPYREIPGLSTTFAANAGEHSYLYTRNLSVEAITSLGRGDNIGNTIAVYCRNADGSAFEGERGAYWATNLVPPGETRVTPTLRWLFVAPATGTYTCVAAVTSYSTIIVDGRRVVMRVPAGAELVRSRYAHGERWTLPSASERVLARGQTVRTLGYTYTVQTDSPLLAITQDAALTTCKPNSSICSGGSSAYDGTSVRTWVEAELQTASGDPCGATLSSTPSNRFVSTPKHHLTATNTLYVDKSDLGDCPRMRVSLVVRNVDGNPVLLHGGHSLDLARTHGVAFEYG